VNQPRDKKTGRLLPVKNKQKKNGTRLVQQRLAQRPKYEQPTAGLAKLDEPELIVSTLLHSRNRTEAAAKLGMTLAQLRTTLARPEVYALFNTVKRELLDDAINKARVQVNGSVLTLAEIMNEPIHPPGARAQAARGVQDFMLRAIELQELQLEVDAIKQRLGIKGNAAGGHYLEAE
jgi:hypothetical protein